MLAAGHLIHRIAAEHSSNALLLGILLIGAIYSILLDEFIMGNAQRRKGPFNLGGYGILSSMVNGFNLMISQLIIPKLHTHYWFQAFPIAFNQNLCRNQLEQASIMALEECEKFYPAFQMFAWDNKDAKDTLKHLMLETQGEV